MRPFGLVRVRVWACWALLGSAFLSGFCAAAPSVPEILARVADGQLDAAGPLVFESTTTFHAEYRDSERAPFHKVIREDVRMRDGECEYRGQYYNERENGTLEKQSEDRDFRIDATKSFFHLAFKADGQMARAAHSAKFEHYDPAKKSQAVKMTGKFWVDSQPVHEALADAEEIRVLPEMVQVDGSDCYVIEGRCASGKYKIWVDPAHGYLWRQGTLTRGVGDLHHGKVLTSDPEEQNDPAVSMPTAPPVAVECEISDVKIQEVEGRFVVVSAVQRSEQLYVNGEVWEASHQFVLDRIEYAPDFEAMGAFRPPLEEGQKVVSWDVSSMPLAYHDRGVVPAMTKRDVEELNSMIDEASVEADRPEQAAPAEETDPLPSERSRQVRSSAFLISGAIGAFLFLVLVLLFFYLRASQRRS